MISDPERAKLDTLAEQIRQAEAAASPLPERDQEETASFSRMGYHLAGIILGSMFVGMLVDKVVPALAPWPLMGMILLGLIVSMVSVWRVLGDPKPKQ